MSSQQSVVTIFRSRLREDHVDEYREWNRRMGELAQSMKGFVSIETYKGSDGARVSIVEFESMATNVAWRDHPEHRQAQALGRERFYAEYRITVCTRVREAAFQNEPAPDAESAAER